MMFVRLVFVELPKTSHLLAELGLGLPVWVAPGNAYELDLLFKRDFRAGQKAHGYIWFSDRSEATADREFRRDQFGSAKPSTGVCGCVGRIAVGVMEHRVIEATRKLRSPGRSDGEFSARSDHKKTAPRGAGECRRFQTENGFAFTAVTFFPAIPPISP